MRANKKSVGGLLATASVLAMGAQALAAAADESQLELVIVTAQKRTENVQQVPASISVLKGADLERMHATSLSDYVAYVPGLSLATQGAPGLNTLTIDGVPPLGAASEVGVYVGDVPIGSSNSFQAAQTLTLDLMPYDLDRVEVLRGPQGTLYGASTMGGLVKYVLASPNLHQFSGRAGGDVFGVHGAGSPGFGVRGMVNLPLLDGRFGLRASAYDQWTPGYIDSGVSGAKRQNGTREYGGRLAALWQPITDFSVELSVMDQKVATNGLAIEALNYEGNQTLYGDLTDDNALPQPFQQEIQVYGATLKYDLHWAQLTSVSSYQRFRNNDNEDSTSFIGPYLPAFGAPGPGMVILRNHLNLKKFTQEVRLASPQGQTLEWLLGGFYTHEDGTKNQVYDSYDLSGAPLAGFDLADAQLPSTYREYAAFGDLTLHLTPKFDVTGGLRYAHNSQDFQQIAGGVLFGGPDTASALFTSSEGVVTFLASPRYHINRNSILYVRIASGYQPGSPNTVYPGVAIPPQVNSSRLIDYQPGVKLTFFDDHLTTDVSAFYIAWKDIQVQVATPDGQASYLANAGKARSQGFDFSASWLPVDGLVLGANIAYTDAYLTTDVPSLSAVSGARLPLVPAWSGSFTADYNFPLGAWRGFVGAGFRQVGRQWSAVEGDTTGVMVPSYHALDLHMGVESDRWTVSVYAKNLNDARAFQAPVIRETDALGLPLDAKAPILQPRTIGLSVDVAF
jgi:iron complex outermembrane recepter protein